MRQYEPKRIGIFGSAFSPITRAHTWSALQAALQLKLDKVYFEPSSNKRKDKNITLEEEHRWNLLKLALEDSPVNQYGEPLFEANDYEMRNEEQYQFTHYTMEYYKERFPNDTVYFIFGTDILRDLPTWELGKELIENNKFIVIERNGYDTEEIFENSEYLKQFRYEKFEIIKKAISLEVSSSYVRKKFNKGQNPQYLLQEKCYNYIIQNKLYNCENYLNNKKSPKKRIGIFGSGFDPITIPQMYTALEVAEQMELEKVIFVPSGQERSDKEVYLNKKDRLRIAELAIQDCPKNVYGKPLFEVSHFELDNTKEKQHTYYTMEYYRKLYHDYDVYFIAGENVVDEMLSSVWYLGERFIKENKFIIMKRDGYDLSKTIANSPFLRYNYYGKFNLIKKDLELEVSDNYIKEDFEWGGNPKYLLPTECYKYIVGNNLYSKYKI